MGASGRVSDVLPGGDVAGLPTDHAGMAVLPFDTCLRLLARESVGRVAFAVGGETVVLPVNHVLDGLTVAFRTSAGSTLTAAEGAALVAFEVDGYDQRTRDGWSVVISGRAEVVTDPATLQRLEDTGLRTWADSMDRPQWVQIHPDTVSGRALIHH